MENSEMRIEVAEGKYTYIFDYSTGKARALRYDEEWRDCVGDGFILALGQEIEALRLRLEAAERDAARWKLTEDLVEGAKTSRFEQIMWGLGFDPYTNESEETFHQHLAIAIHNLNKLTEALSAKLGGAEPIARLEHTSVGAKLFVHGIQIPSFKIGCAYDEHKQSIVDRINAAAPPSAVREPLSDAVIAQLAADARLCTRIPIGSSYPCWLDGDKTPFVRAIEAAHGIGIKPAQEQSGTVGGEG